MILLCCTASFRNNTSSSLLRAAATTTMTTMTMTTSSSRSSSVFSLSTSSSSSLLLSSSLKATTTTNLRFSTMITDTTDTTDTTDISDISDTVTDISNDESNNKSKSKKSKYYTIGITGSTGLIGTALQNELMSLNNNGSSSSSSKGKGIGEGIGGVNGKPVRIITFKRGQKAEIINNPNTFFNDDTFTFKKSITWNPYANHNDDNNSNNNSADTDNIANNNDNNNNIAIDTTIIKNLDAIIHLSGENISTGEQGMLFASLGIRPWTISKKQKIINSRIITTSALATAISKSGNTKCVFLCASGIGVYGNDYYKIDNNNNNNNNINNDNENEKNEKEPADETMDITKTKGFLPEVSRLWEAASKILVSVSSSESLLESEQDQSTSTSTSTTNNRVCQLRNGVVLSKLGGALGKLYPIFYLGGGGIVGDGTQYFPFISSRDMSRAMIHILQTPSLDGVININAPIPATNYDFTVAMGNIMNRPVLIPFPKFAVSILFGEMGEEVLLGGTKATPKKLLDSGFIFLDPTVDDAVRSAVLSKKNKGD